jgi:hypothetical protein
MQQAVLNRRYGAEIATNVPILSNFVISWCMHESWVFRSAAPSHTVAGASASSTDP